MVFLGEAFQQIGQRGILLTCQGTEKKEANDQSLIRHSRLQEHIPDASPMVVNQMCWSRLVLGLESG